MYRNNKDSLQIDKRKSGSMISRDAFLERINQEGFSFSIEIPRRNFSDFKSLVRRRRISEEDLYQLFYNYCQELENCLKEAGEKVRTGFGLGEKDAYYTDYFFGYINRNYGISKKEQGDAIAFGTLHLPYDGNSRSYDIHSQKGRYILQCNAVFLFYRCLKR